MTQTNPNEISPERALEQLIANASQFQEARQVLQEWLARLGIYMAHHHGWFVGLSDQRTVGKIISQQVFPTFAQALAYALNEAQWRIMEAGAANSVGTQDKREGAGDAQEAAN